MAKILIPNKGEYHSCLYDQEDHDLISSYTWSLHPEGYAYTKVKGKIILMHRLVMGVLNQPGIEVDHMFHNKLDNQKAHLRLCTRSENRRNSRKLTPGTSKYKGVYFEAECGLFHAQLGFDKKVKNLGRSSNEISAAKAYDRKALEVFQDFACTNFQSSREAIQLKLPWI